MAEDIQVEGEKLRISSSIRHQKNKKAGKQGNI